MTSRGADYVTMTVRVSRRALKRITSASTESGEPIDAIAARLLEENSRDLWPIPDIRELYVLHYSREEIAQRLNIHESTVRRHLAAIKKDVTL